RALVSLLPTQHDANLLYEHTNAWALEICLPYPDLPSRDEQLCPFDLNTITQSELTVIGRTLLGLALYMQQLSPDFDINRLQMADPGSLVHSYIEAVNSHVLSDEAIMCSLDGLDCMLLLGMIHINDANIQRAWMTFRRALDASRLMGLYKSYAKSKRDSMSKEMITHRRMWLATVMGSCYTSLLLGLECGIGSQPFGPDDGWNDPAASVTANFQRKVCSIVDKLIQRNLFKLDEGYWHAQALDEALDELYNSMPSTWQAIPVLTRDRSIESARRFDDILHQLWFFQIRAFTYLPYIFRAATEKRLEYCKSACQESSREVLRRYLVTRQVENTQLHCRVIDFAAFVSALTLLLLFIQSSNSVPAAANPRGNSDDMVLIKEVVQSMKTLAESNKRETISRQGVDVLSALSTFAYPSPATPRKLRLTVPYFGTIAVIMDSKPASEMQPASVLSTSLTTENAIAEQPVERFSEQGGPMPHERFGGDGIASRSVNLTFANEPFFQADSFQIPPSWNFTDAETLVFDGIWDSDIMDWNI
ncbi:hypothetical protein NA57DRAFT_47457, partial [Rhizodiscina lignyota]